VIDDKQLINLESNHLCLGRAFAINTLIHERLHLTGWNFARACISASFRNR